MTEGPFVQMAAFCEKALREEDGVLSAIRIIDHITHVTPKPDSPEDAPVAHLTALIGLKSGNVQGKRTVTFQPRPPSGNQVSPTQFVVVFEGEEKGVNVSLQMRYRTDEAGLHWFDVWVEDQLLTQMPLRITFQPQSADPSR